jgi:uncharacterized protein with HEPN domain
MPSERGRRRPTETRQNIRLIQEWTNGLDCAAFRSDLKTIYAVTRALEIVSEASRGLDTETKARFPNLPWTDIAGAGNIYRHNYEFVTHERVWETATVSLLPLLAAVEAELGDDR